MSALPPGFVLDGGAESQSGGLPPGFTLDAAPTPSTSTGQALARGAAQGLTAGFYDEAVALSKAGGSNYESGKPFERMGLDHLIMGLAKYWFGDKDAQAKYDEAVKGERAFTKATEAEHPVASTVGNVAGAVAMPLGVGGAATLPVRMARGAGVGAAMGGIAGIGEGEGLTDSITKGLSGAAVGGALGGAAPAVVEGVIRGGRAIAQPIVNTVRGIVNPEAEAGRRTVTALARDIGADPNAVNRLTPQEYAASVQNGGPATIMDLGGETTRALARSAANTSPEGRQVLNETINNRFEGQTARVSDWLRHTFHFPDAQAQQEAIEQTSRVVNRQRYAQAYRDGARPLWDDNLQNLTVSPDVQAAIRNATRTGANDVDNFKRVDIDTPVADRSYKLVITKRASSPAITRNFTIVWTGLKKEVTTANEQNETVKEFSLSEAYPNPFNPTTRFTLQVAKS
ncbi:MAG: hypothetical protein E6R03_03345, partial [Hyphomicrobiaceae bacterium]